MAECGTGEGVISIIEVGAKLSVVLLDFGRSVGAASTEITQIGIEISLFCSVLKQLHWTLTKTKRSRYSIGALEQTLKIMDRCREIFNEIERIVSGIKFSYRKDKDLIPRLIWVFKRLEVRVLRTTLESCKITLHLMLHTLEVAQKSPRRRISYIETQENEVITRSLEAARQCTINILEQLENENPEFESTSTSQTIPWKPNARLANKIRKIKPDNAKHQDTIGPDLRTKRASAWVRSLIVDEMNNSLVSLDFQQEQQPSSPTQQTLDEVEHQECSSIQELEAVESNTRFKTTTTLTA